MKKILTVLFLLAIVTISIFADEYTVSTYTFYDKTYFDAEEMEIRYDDKTKKFYMRYSPEWIIFPKTVWMEFTKDDLISMRNTAKKALEWKEIAIKNNVDITKELPDSVLYSYLYEKSNSDYYKGSSRVPVLFYFISSDNLTCLLINGDKTKTTTNRYIDIEFIDQIIMDIEEFANAISEETIQDAINKHNNNNVLSDTLFK